MSLDLFVLSLFLLLSLWGWWTGALAQVARIGALVVVYWGATPLAKPVGELFLSGFELPEGVRQIGAYVIAASAIYLTFSFLIFIVHRFVIEDVEPLSRANRMAGVVVGGFKAAVISYLLLTAVVAVEDQLKSFDPFNKYQLRRGHLTALAKQYNVIAPWEFEEIEHLSLAVQYVRALREGDIESGVVNSKDLEMLTRNTKILELASDKQMVRALAKPDYLAVMWEPRVRALLKNPKIDKQLERVDWAPVRAVLGGDKDAEAERDNDSGKKDTKPESD